MPPRSPNESLASDEAHHRGRSSTESIVNDLRRSDVTAKPVNPNKQRNPANDHATMRSDDSAAAPSSVYLGSAITLNRELSDLSGSYVNGAASRGGLNSKGTGAVPGHIYDDANTFKGPWRHAFVLSEQPPPLVVRQQQHSANGSVGSGGIIPSKPRADATIFVDRNDIVEVVKRQDSIDQGFGGRAMAADSLTSGESIHKRIPIMVLLMHPSQKTYEIMQLWADRSTDSVRSVVITMQQSIPMKWKQAYDGIFQMRGNKLTQLIHILSLEKYEIQPHEILVAKPWSMPSNVT
jgi:hypothetical protein